MSSDSDYDHCDYYSSEESSSIDEQIDRFEFRHYIKSGKTKQKTRKSACPISRRTLKSQANLVRMNCRNDEKTQPAERKPYRYDHCPPQTKMFECDEHLQEMFNCPDPNLQFNTIKMLEVEHLQSFSNFRRSFYHAYHQSIKASFDDHPHIKIIDIRLAQVNESVQNDFMQQLQRTRHFPLLVYHGTALSNTESILRYGLLIPNQMHPSNSKAPVIKLVHGNSYGPGIYCSRTASYSLTYNTTINTLLVCAAIPKRDKLGKVSHCHGNILVLTHVSRIIPILLMDMRYLDQYSINRPLFKLQEKFEMDENNDKKLPSSAVVISRKYLRKILNALNDHERRNNQYQLRSFSE